MPFQESAESLKAKAHMSTVKTPVLLGVAALALVVLFLVFQGIWDFVQRDGLTIYRQDAPQQDAGGNGPGPSADAADRGRPTLCIHVGGAVQSPGVYELEEGSRVLSAVEAAGGFTENASLDAVNLARKLVDGEQVLILTVEEAASHGTEAVQGAAPAKGKVNINNAVAGELMALPGVGEVTAKKIIADREANGPFASLEDLMRVSGIGEKKFADLAPFITL